MRVGKKEEVKERLYTAHVDFCMDNDMKDKREKEREKGKKK